MIDPAKSVSGGPPGQGGEGEAQAPLEIIDLGRRSYEDVYALQQERLAARIRGDVPDAVFLVEHDEVVTRGRRSATGDTAAVPFPVVTIERGGEATYHGPGQIVAYPILALPEGQRDLHRYLRDLEEVVIQALAAVGVEGRREDGYTGVWIGEHKVCSIGVAVRRWVTWHGLALNVTTDLAAFSSFAPCGLSSSVMTRAVDHMPNFPVKMDGSPAKAVVDPGESEAQASAMEQVKDALRASFRDWLRP